MTQAGMEQAFEQVDTELADDDVLVVYLPDCHESLAGIIAGQRAGSLQQASPLF